jgi:hypothetical protein
VRAIGDAELLCDLELVVVRFEVVFVNRAFELSLCVAILGFLFE